MGMLVDGAWQQQDVRRANADGDFVRPESPYRHKIGGEDDQFPAVDGRYHLFVNAGCPWAYRTILYRSIKDLSSTIGLSYTNSAAGSEGWTFGDPESLLGAQHIHDVYTAADSSFTGRCTVPVLWDKQTSTIVNNESSDIIRMLDCAFSGEPEYYPEELGHEIDEINGTIYSNVNNGVYRCGFARSQQAYNEAFDRLFSTLDALDHRLSKQRYLLGDAITEADWRLFATLVRFDTAYYGQFRCNRNLLMDFDNLWPYTRDLFQQKGVAETVDIEAIKGIYYGSRPPHILPRGPEIDFTARHGRG
jgi:putative glutathione S-transferase